MAIFDDLHFLAYDLECDIDHFRFDIGRCTGVFRRGSDNNRAIAGNRRLSTLEMDRTERFAKNAARDRDVDGAPGVVAADFRLLAALMSSGRTLRKKMSRPMRFIRLRGWKFPQSRDILAKREMRLSA